MHIDKTDKIKIETAGQLYYMMCEVLSNLPKVRCPDSAAGLSADVKKIYQLWKVKIEFSSTYIYMAVGSVFGKNMGTYHKFLSSSDHAA